MMGSAEISTLKTEGCKKGHLNNRDGLTVDTDPISAKRRTTADNCDALQHASRLPAQTHHQVIGAVIGLSQRLIS
jgi:uncharacterized protein YcfJ